MTDPTLRDLLIEVLAYNCAGEPAISTVRDELAEWEPGLLARIDACLSAPAGDVEADTIRAALAVVRHYTSGPLPSPAADPMGHHHLLNLCRIASPLVDGRLSAPAGDVASGGRPCTCDLCMAKRTPPKDAAWDVCPTCGKIYSPLRLGKRDCPDPFHAPKPAAGEVDDLAERAAILDAYNRERGCPRDGLDRAAVFVWYARGWRARALAAAPKPGDGSNAQRARKLAKEITHHPPSAWVRLARRAVGEAEPVRDAEGRSVGEARDVLWLVVPATHGYYEVHAYAHCQGDEDGACPMVIADARSEAEAVAICTALNKQGTDSHALLRAEQAEADDETTETNKETTE